MSAFKDLITDKRLYIGFFLLLFSGLVILFLADRVIMPAYTKYNQGVTVPDVTKVAYEDAIGLLQQAGLRYEIIDRRSNEAFPPNFVLDQAPRGNMLVKPNRKVYLTVNAAETPMVSVPDVQNISLRNAQIQLQSHGLEPGFVEYVSSRFPNIVMGQSVPAGESVRRGTPINLVVSDGLGMNRVAVPEIIGKRLAIAQREIRQSGLRIGQIVFQPVSGMEPNLVISFSPAEADSLFEGERIDLVVSELSNLREAEERGVEIDDQTELGRVVPDSLIIPQTDNGSDNSDD
ncbi:MAG: PASTA domain-containing protein [Candidatus Cyclonatronum sp.]|uniref:PASTA domain-containing protein n=1 Tax=Cyclonatronum sp. TaxID=3024185 RepID=UPI0025C2D3CA|nr:PASTA domain-containing protein [Cyclonatronum sp.]MCC5933902.1 PASTA domain-containing protein [Balneolales bacterium]MCH8486300.1 PASTA domain-containing protein [Cyclonatronum sp.]